MPATSELRSRYVILVEVGLLIALALVLAAFAAPIDFDEDVTVIVTTNEVIKTIEIPVTEQRRDLPPPPPPAPIEVPDTQIIENQIDIPALSETLGGAAVRLVQPEMPPLEPPPVDTEEIFVVVEERPVLIGGLEGLQKRVTYPELARRAGIQGTVYVQFVVDKEGRVEDPVCARDPGGGTCEEALRAVRASQFTPGKQRGKRVKVRFALPIRFRLR